MANTESTHTGWFIRTTKDQRNEVKARCKRVGVSMSTYLWMLHQNVKKRSDAEIVQMCADARIAELKERQDAKGQ